MVKIPFLRWRRRESVPMENRQTAAWDDVPNANPISGVTDLNLDQTNNSNVYTDETQE